MKRAITTAILCAIIAQPLAGRQLVLRCREIEPCRPGAALDFCRPACRQCAECPSPTEAAAGSVGCPRPDRGAYCLGDGGSAPGWCRDALGCSGCPPAGNAGGAGVISWPTGGEGVGGEGGVVVWSPYNPFASAARAVKSTTGSTPQGAGATTASATQHGKIIRPTATVDLVIALRRDGAAVQLLTPRASSGLQVMADPESGRLFLVVRPGDREPHYIGELLPAASGGGIDCYHSGRGGGRWGEISLHAVAVLPPLSAGDLLAARMQVFGAWLAARLVLPASEEMTKIADTAAELWQSGKAGAIPWRSRDWPTAVPGRSSTAQLRLRLLQEQAEVTP